MRVLHVIAPGPFAGAERVVAGGCAALAGAGARVGLVALGDARTPDAARMFVEAASGGGVPAERIDGRGRWDESVFRALRHRMDDALWDVIHAHGYKGLFYAAMARRPGTPLVVTHHGDTAVDATVRLYEQLARALYRGPQVARVFAVSRDGFADLRTIGVPGDKLLLVPNFLALDLAPPRPPRRQAGAPLRLVAIGRLSPEKGLDVLLCALARGPRDMTLTVVGDGPERRRLEVQARRLGLAERVGFAGYRTDVARVLDEAHAVVMPSRREGLPMALLEAMAAARPVVASAAGGMPDVIRDGGHGRLVPPDDVEALESALAELDRRFEEWARAALERAREVRRDFGSATWAARTLEAYGGVVGGASRLEAGPKDRP